MIRPHARQFGEDPIAELVAGARECERRVRVQALEAAAPRRACDPEGQLGTEVPLFRLGGPQARGEPRVGTNSVRPARDAARCLEPRYRGDEVRARQPECCRERIAALVERSLLGYRRAAERTADGDAAKCARRPTELLLDHITLSHWGAA